MKHIQRSESHEDREKNCTHRQHRPRSVENCCDLGIKDAQQQIRPVLECVLDT